MGRLKTWAIIVAYLMVASVVVCSTGAREKEKDVGHPPLPKAVMVKPGEPTLFPPGFARGGEKGDKEIRAIVLTRWGGAQCSGAIIEPRNKDGSYHILTAYHCDPQGQTVKVRLSDQSIIDAKSVAGDKTVDVRWLVTVRKDLKTLPMVKLSRKIPPNGTKVWHRSFGIDKPGNLEKGRLTQQPNQQGQIEFDLSVSPGDSGGPFFTEAESVVLAPACCTTCLGCRGRVWGGSCVIAWHLRPGYATPETALEVARTWSDRPAPSMLTFSPVLSIMNHLPGGGH